MDVFNFTATPSMDGAPNLVGGDITFRSRRTAGDAHHYPTRFEWAASPSHTISSTMELVRLAVENRVIVKRDGAFLTLLVGLHLGAFIPQNDFFVFGPDVSKSRVHHSILFAVVGQHLSGTITGKM